MTDTETETIELTRGEVRKVIAALARYEPTATGQDDQRVRNLRERLRAEFEFDEYRQENRDNDGWLQDIVEVFDDEENEEDVEFTRAEAEDTLRALSDLETEIEPEEYETIRDIEVRLEDAFDIGRRGGDRTDDGVL